jgi:hypothetical protein
MEMSMDAALLGNGIFIETLTKNSASQKREGLQMWAHHSFLEMLHWRIGWG